MYYFAIIDDDIDDQNNFSARLQEECKLNEINYTCDTYSSTLEFNYNIIYDAIFLDINMPEENGIQFAVKLNQKYETKIIIITNHANYMYATLDIHPFHFIHKESLKIESIRVLKILFNALEKENIFIKVNTNKGKKEIRKKEIYYIQSCDHLASVFLRDSCENLFVWDSLTHLAEQYNFIKINRSIIINLKYIKCFTTKKIQLKNDVEFNFGEHYYENFEKIYSKYLLGDIEYD